MHNRRPVQIASEQAQLLPSSALQIQVEALEAGLLLQNSNCRPVEASQAVYRICQKNSTLKFLRSCIQQLSSALSSVFCHSSAFWALKTTCTSTMSLHMV